MLLKRRGPLPVLALALALVGVSEGVAAAQTPREVALKYAVDNAQAFGVTPADVANLTVTYEYRSAHNGVTHVNVEAGPRGPGGLRGQRDDQRRQRQPRDLRGRQPRAPAPEHRVQRSARRRRRGRGRGRQARPRQPGGPARAALQECARHGPLHGRDLGRADPGQAGLLGDEGRPAPGVEVTIDDAEDGHLWEVTVDAASGALLRKDDWSSHAKTPNPVNDGSSYRVFEFPKQDPNDGERTLVTNPADAFASPFGWHDTNGVTGPEFTTTQGNNAHAYSDRDNNNQPDPGSEAQGGPTLQVRLHRRLLLTTSRSPTRTPRSRTSSTGATWSTTSRTSTGSTRSRATSRCQQLRSRRRRR